MSAAREVYVWVDFNGTLVSHAKGAPLWDAKGELIVGTPVREMVARVRRHMSLGRKFVIKSAMMSDSDAGQRAKVEKAIGDWTEKHLGRRLEVTATCRPEFIDQWDDKARNVVRNTGRFAEKIGDDDDGERTEAGPRGHRRAEGAGAPAHSIRAGKLEERGGSGGGQRAREHFSEWTEWGDDGG